MSDAINAFLSDRKAGWLKKKTSPGMTAEELMRVEQEANHIFSPECWLPDASKRAGWLSMVSHPGKFSHPAAKISPLIAESERSSDGFLRTGNANAQLDILGNAAAMDVFKFLSLVLEDGQTILAHLECDTEVIKNEMKVSTMSYEVLRNGFLAIKKNPATTITSECVKQVYFPVADDYHLLSILTPSGLVYELRNRIHATRFSDEIKEARDNKRKNLYNEDGFDELYNLSMIGYGGTKPQNISVLNSNYGGKSYLLSSSPPDLSRQHVKRPKSNFFTNSLWTKKFENDFFKIHDLFTMDRNNEQIRKNRDEVVQTIIDDVIEHMWALRLAEHGWSENTNLPDHQKIWLDESRKEERYTNETWLDDISSDFARWFIVTYEKLLGTKAVMLDDIDLKHFKHAMKKNEEDLL
ncbi:type I-F CRISPR-associated protein Csy1 [uncultured Legionella sp.]|uniref:type I-F CRISPR-associated protein Csy1 n=1 Tax=uncultured Legionella sp. TaxID=210934 RepID=UPI0026178DF4|nr:type I-F CRISPR-associated protein Csy1 [uncultured Legionella sp.]